ncbi:unnamed protein product [Symbiodinium sp. CCMP2592]|nr:unnamed protein product [Symbiodinium sp. CCMP2592]
MSLAPEDHKVIADLLQKAAAGSLLQSMNTLMQHLFSRNLAWRLRLNPDLVGVHYENRDGQGVSASHVQDLISSIASIGFVETELRSVCVEVPDDHRGDRVREFNRALVAESSSKLAPVDMGNIRYASIVGSHSNQTFRAFRAAVMHHDQKVTIDNRLSVEKVATFDQAWATAIKNGVEWTIIAYSVTEAFEQFVPLAQSAGNTAAQVAAVEHELQLASKVNRSIDAMLKKQGKSTVQYSDVAPEILRSRPPSASALPGIFAFVVKCGGGCDPESFLSKSERHIRAHGQPKRSLGPEMWQALSSEVKGKLQYVHWRHMLLKLAFTGQDKVLSASDVRKALQGGMLAKAAEAEKMSRDMQSILNSANHLTPEVKFATLSEVEVEMAAVILQKKKFTKRETVYEACNDCLQGLGLTSPWVSSASSSQNVSPSKDGAELGFQVGNMVIRKADEVVGTIKKMTADHVDLVLQDFSACRVSSQSFVEGLWRHHVPKAEAVPLPDWSAHAPSVSKDFVFSCVKSVVLLQMREQWMAFTEATALDVFVKPRDVQVSKDFGQGKLCLPVTSPRLDIRSSSSTSPSGSIKAGCIKTSSEDHILYILPMVQFPKDGQGSGQGFVNPTWIMRTTSDRTEANMEVVGKGSEKLTPDYRKIQLPYVKNIRKVSAGQSLLLYRPETGKPEQPEALRPLSKKLRTQ